jgi:hypothetical protein
MVTLLALMTPIAALLSSPVFEKFGDMVCPLPLTTVFDGTFICAVLVQSAVSFQTPAVLSSKEQPFTVVSALTLLVEKTAAARNPSTTSPVVRYFLINPPLDGAYSLNLFLRKKCVIAHRMLVV